MPTKSPTEINEGFRMSTIVAYGKEKWGQIFSWSYSDITKNVSDMLPFSSIIDLISLYISTIMFRHLPVIPLVINLNQSALRHTVSKALGTDHYFPPGGIMISRRQEIFSTID